MKSMWWFESSSFSNSTGHVFTLRLRQRRCDYCWRAEAGGNSLSILPITSTVLVVSIDEGNTTRALVSRGVKGGNSILFTTLRLMRCSNLSLDDVRTVVHRGNAQRHGVNQRRVHDEVHVVGVLRSQVNHALSQTRSTRWRGGTTCCPTRTCCRVRPRTPSTPHAPSATLRGTGGSAAGSPCSSSSGTGAPPSGCSRRTRRKATPPEGCEVV